jgi:hypothetical protein
LFSYGTNEAATAGMPPSAKIDLAPTERVVTETITLPVRGYPSRYPFDTYELWLGVVMARVQPDGTVQPLSRAEGAPHLLMTLQAQLPREYMLAPDPADPNLDRDPEDPYEMPTLTALRFERPLHDRVLAVLLIAAAAAYAVFMRPLQDLVIGSGALVLGVWGIRAIVTPGTAYRMMVDLALSAVILFLLGAVTVRAFQHCYQQGGLRLRRGSLSAAPPPGPEPTRAGDQCDAGGGCPNTIALHCESCRRAFCPRHIRAGLLPRCDACASAAAEAGMGSQDGVRAAPVPPVGAP